MATVTREEFEAGMLALTAQIGILQCQLSASLSVLENQGWMEQYRRSLDEEAMQKWRDLYRENFEMFRQVGYQSSASPHSAFPALNIIPIDRPR